MTAWLASVRAALGRTATLVALLAVLGGVIAFATGIADADAAPRTYGTFIGSWLLVAGLTAGGCAYLALFRVIGARWPQPLGHIGAAFLDAWPVALVGLFAIILGAGAWLHADPDSSWMSRGALGTRDLLLTGGLFACGAWLRRSEGGASPTVYLLLYGTALSFWAFDLVLGADATFESTMIGPFLFTSAFVASAGLVTLLGLRRGVLRGRAPGDAAALTLALAIFWAYLFWSQYLTIWYGNLPDEIAFAIRRTESGWTAVVLAVVGLVFALPFASLLHPFGRRRPRVVGALLALQLGGFWLLGQLLLVPSLTPDGGPLGVRDLAIALGLFAAFALAVAPGVSRALTLADSRAANPGEPRAHTPSTTGSAAAPVAASPERTAS